MYPIDLSYHRSGDYTSTSTQRTMYKSTARKRCYHRRSEQRWISMGLHHRHIHADTARRVLRVYTSFMLAEMIVGVIDECEHHAKRPRGCKRASILKIKGWWVKMTPKKGSPKIEVCNFAKRTVTSEPTRREELKNDLFGSEARVLI